MDHNNNNSQRGADMNDFERKLDKILENQVEQGKSIVKIETYQKSYNEKLNEVKIEQSDQDKRIDAINGKVNKAIGAGTAVLLAITFLFEYLGVK